MKRGLFYLILLMYSSSFSYAQVGIGTNDPKATLEVVAQNIPGVADGIIIPKITRERAKQMTNVDHATLVYVVDAVDYVSTDTSKASNVDTKGFYFYNSDIGKWVKMPDFEQSLSANYWKAQGTSTSPPINNKGEEDVTNDNIGGVVNVDIFQKGKVGIGYVNPLDITSNFDINRSPKQLDVFGDFRTMIAHSEKTTPEDITYYGIETNSIALPSQYATRGNVLYSAKSKNLEDYSYYDRPYEGSILIQSKDELNFLSRKGVLKNEDATKNALINEFRVTANSTENIVGKVNSNASDIRGSNFNVDFYNLLDGTNPSKQFGLNFLNNTHAFYIGNNYDEPPYAYSSHYQFPVARGQKGQILKLSNDKGQLDWESADSSPSFFYMPSIILPTNSTDTRITTSGSYQYNSGTFSVNLYELFSNQFYEPVASSIAITPTTPIEDTLEGFVKPASYYNYFVTHADSNVFTNIKVSADGILTYEIVPNSIIRNGSFMNIVLKVK